MVESGRAGMVAEGSEVGGRVVPVPVRLWVWSYEVRGAGREALQPLEMEE